MSSERPQSLEKKRPQNNLINVYKYPVGGNEEDGGRPFSVVPTEMRRGNGHKLKHRQFYLNIRNFVLHRGRASEHPTQGTDIISDNLKVTPGPFPPFSLHNGRKAW
ncbi:hypothetical protein QYF61_013616 [Mycteria americana]|uniref:Uncharacterized protein n=1 Tax=Mycteria americana TaxID=33587 RepID=A0AAN7PSZ3_MYCAM|nr:hypothetical protein QYF61_013616 [Mycteria americana]